MGGGGYRPSKSIPKMAKTKLHDFGFVLYVSIKVTSINDVVIKQEAVCELGVLTNDKL